MVLERVIDDVSSISNQLISKLNLGPIRFMESNNRITSNPTITGDYELILRNKFENSLLVPVNAYGWKGKVCGITTRKGFDFQKLETVLPQFYLNPYVFGFPIPYTTISFLHIDDIFIRDNNTFIIWT